MIAVPLKIVACQVHTTAILFAGIDISESIPLAPLVVCQWVTGAVTFALLGLQTLSMVTHDGIWEFLDTSRHRLGPEIWAQVSLGLCRRILPLFCS